MSDPTSRTTLVEIVGAEPAATSASVRLPAVIKRAGKKASKRFLEFFTANIRNRNTREAYARAVGQFMAWCEEQGVELHQLEPTIVAVYVEELSRAKAKSTVKQHLAAIRMLMDWLVVGQVLPMNPAAAVRGPKLVVRSGKTPVLFEDDAQTLFEAIDVSTVVGLRDRAILGVMTYSFSRVSALVGMRVSDYYTQGRRAWLHLEEKGGRDHRVPVHHKAAEYVEAYILAAGIGEERDAPLFRTARGRSGVLNERPMSRDDVLRMVKRRVRAAGLPPEICNHTFRATGITNYLQHGGTVEKAAQIAGHASTRTTQLYNRTDDEVSLDEIERIRI